MEEQDIEDAVVPVCEVCRGAKTVHMQNHPRPVPCPACLGNGAVGWSEEATGFWRRAWRVVRVVLCAFVWLYWARRIPFTGLGGLVVFVAAGAYLGLTLFKTLLHWPTGLESPVASSVRAIKARLFRDPGVSQDLVPHTGPRLDAYTADAGDEDDLTPASRTWWFVKAGRQGHPPADYRVQGGHQVLGRFVDPYTCQQQLNAVREKWQGAWWGLTILVGTVLAIFGVHVLPLALVAILWLAVRARYARIYTGYLGAQKRALETERPQWMPYSRRRQVTESAIERS
jgi:hypothetical protein